MSQIAVFSYNLRDDYCDKNYMAHKFKIFTVWPFLKKAYPLLVSLISGVRSLSSLYGPFYNLSHLKVQ